MVDPRRAWIQQRLFDLTDKRNERFYAWLRQLLLLAAGVLTVLAGIATARPHTSYTHTQATCLRAAWIGIGSGILLGTMRLYGEVWTLDELRRKAKQLGDKWLADGGRHAETDSIVYASLPWWLSLSGVLCCLSLISSVISLVTFAVLAT